MFYLLLTLTKHLVVFNRFNSQPYILVAAFKLMNLCTIHRIHLRTYVQQKSFFWIFKYELCHEECETSHNVTSTNYKIYVYGCMNFDFALFLNSCETPNQYITGPTHDHHHTQGDILSKNPNKIWKSIAINIDYWRYYFLLFKN